MRPLFEMQEGFRCCHVAVGEFSAIAWAGIRLSDSSCESREQAFQKEKG